METLLRDVRYGFRMLLRTPSVTALAALALALGIGANTAIFSAVYAVLLRPLPIRDAGRLVSIESYNPKFNIPPIHPGFTVAARWKGATSFESMAASWSGVADLEIGRETARVPFWRLSASFFDTLGVRPAIGRGFSVEEDRPGGPAVALISYDLWQRRFASEPLAQRTLKLNGAVYSIVGVMPPGFDLDGKPADVFGPIAVDPADRKTYLPVTVYARLRPGVAVARAQSEMDSIMQPDPRGWRARVSLLRDSMVRDVRLSLLVLLGAVGMVLLIACANIASLLLARAGARSRETAIRAALGASKRRLAAQFLVESALLALLGGAAGLLLATWCMRLIPLLDDTRLPTLLLATRIDPAVLAFTMALSLVTSVIFGAAPALTGASTDVQGTLKEGGAAGVGRGRRRLWNALVVTETALAVTLLIGATLLVRSFLYLRDTAPGFRIDGLMTATISPARARYTTPEAFVAFYDEALRRVRAIPGVASASLATSLPLDGDYRGMSYPIEGVPYARPQDWPALWYRAVDPEYFRTMQIPLRRGRFFDGRDRLGAPRVMIINESMARRYWPSGDAIGKHIGVPGNKDYFEIVGVAADVRHQDATKDGLTEVFLPYLQGPAASMKFAVRADGRICRNALALAPLVERAVAAADPTVKLTNVQDVQQMASDRLSSKRLTAGLIAVFAGLALALSAIGIYGVLSFTVSRRTHEIGIRIALGASAASVVRAVVGRATALAAIGVAGGIAAALALGRVVSTLVFGVSRTDPLIFAGASVALLGVAALAAYIPARRAAHVDPIAALRHD
jgi:putative ABC transport system permease protein